MRNADTMIMKLSKNILSVFICCICLISLFSCRKKQSNPANIEENLIKTKHTWYYFSEGNYIKTDKIHNVPNAVQKPWTEAVRISSAVIESEQNNGIPKGFATINHLGILVFQGESIHLYTDKEIFNGRTAGNLVFANNTPFFSVYKSTFFNETKSALELKHPFLVQFNPEQNILYPVIEVENLGLESSAEINDFIFDGQYWTCSIKNSTDEKIDFSYITFQTKEDINLITPYDAEKMIHISSSDTDSFRNAKKPKDFSNAPERLKNLLATIPASIDFSVTVANASGHTPRTFIRTGKNNTDSDVLTAKAIISDTWAACLFNDGTLYLQGALYNKNILNGGKTLGIRLPKLPQNFTYGDFVISGTMLYSSWEETSFYKTQRSGFLSVDLNRTLYKR